MPTQSKCLRWKAKVSLSQVSECLQSQEQSLLSLEVRMRPIAAIQLSVLRLPHQARVERESTRAQKTPRSRRICHRCSRVANWKVSVYCDMKFFFIKLKWQEFFVIFLQIISKKNIEAKCIFKIWLKRDISVYTCVWFTYLCELCWLIFYFTFI